MRIEIPERMMIGLVYGQKKRKTIGMVWNGVAEDNRMWKNA